MGVPSLPAQVKLVAGLLSPSSEALTAARTRLEAVYGPSDSRSERAPFDFTRYYNSELGPGIMREYVSFRDLVKAGDAVRIKRQTNKLEMELAVDGRRTVNIDPGYITTTKLVIMSTKDAPSRVYMGDGIYGQAMLQYFKGSYRPREWTYPDYREASAIAFFNEARSVYKKQLKEMKTTEYTEKNIMAIAIYFSSFSIFSGLNFTELS